jgi:hypothetical protein
MGAVVCFGELLGRVIVEEAQLLSGLTDSQWCCVERGGVWVVHVQFYCASPAACG